MTRLDGSDLALVGGTVYPDPASEPLLDATVLIRGASIESVTSGVPPQDAAIIDCRNLTITAGFWNSHVHFFERMWANAADIPAAELAQQLRAMSLRFGFTTVFDLGSSLANTKRIRDRAIDGPAIYTTGEGLVPRGALPPDSVLNLMGVFASVKHTICRGREVHSALR